MRQLSDMSPFLAIASFKWTICSRWTVILLLLGLCGRCVLAEPGPEKPFGQKLLVIAYDGLRYDFITEELTPNIYRAGKAGVMADKGMTSVFPTSTTPNFYAMSTGLFAENSGIVGNVMFDASRDYTKFDYWDFGNDSEVLAESLKENWWTGSPLFFLNNQDAGTQHRTGCMFWPTCDIESSRWAMDPDRVKRWEDYGELPDWTRDFNELMTWYEDEERPIDFGLFYISIPDQVEHYHDIYGPEVREVIRSLDTLFGHIMETVRGSAVTKDMNVVLVADHGHININLPDNLISVEEEYPLEKQNLTHFGGAEWSFHPADKKEKPAEFWDDMYNSLSEAKRKRNLPFSVFRRDDPALAGFHYQNQPTKIGPIVAIADPGYVLVWNTTVEEMMLQPKYANKTAIGTHGYSNEAPEMRALFVANGPAFKCHYEVKEPFLNIHLYPLFAHILGIRPDPATNGSLDAVRHLLRPSASPSSTTARPGANGVSGAWPCADAAQTRPAESIDSVKRMASSAQSNHLRNSAPMLVAVLLVVLPVASFVCYCLVTSITPRQTNGRTKYSGVSGGVGMGGERAVEHAGVPSAIDMNVFLQQPMMKMENA